MRFSAALAAFILATTPHLHAAPADKLAIKSFARVDLDRNESLDRGEFAGILPAKWRQGGILDETLDAMFLWFDTDRSGGIDLGEWLDGKAWNNQGFPDFPYDVADELDTNLNGKLSWGEFNRVIGRFVPVTVVKHWHANLGQLFLSQTSGLSLVVISGHSMFWDSQSGTFSTVPADQAINNIYTGTTTVSSGQLSTSGSSSDPGITSEWLANQPPR